MSKIKEMILTGGGRWVLIDNLKNIQWGTKKCDTNFFKPLDLHQGWGVGDTFSASRRCLLTVVSTVQV